MRAFFRTLGVIDADDRPGPRFGDPLWVYVQYRRKKGDTRPEPVIRAEGEKQMAAARSRGTFLAQGHGARPHDLEPQLAREVRRVYEEGKKSIWAELDPEFRASMAGSLFVATRSASRSDYILHPTSGEELGPTAVAAIQGLRKTQAGRFDVQIVVSDGLNALSIMDGSQLSPFLKKLREGLARDGHVVALQEIVVTGGRVRAGYRIGEILFGGLPGRRAVLHVIGERPGTGHNNFSVYMTCPGGDFWGQAGKVDHDITRVVAGISSTSLAPELGAEAALRILRDMWQPGQASGVSRMRSVISHSRWLMKRVVTVQGQ
jgi:ethanolamine ammonia-lyase large subunit